MISGWPGDLESKNFSCSVHEKVAEKLWDQMTATEQTCALHICAKKNRSLKKSGFLCGVGNAGRIGCTYWPSKRSQNGCVWNQHGIADTVLMGLNWKTVVCKSENLSLWERVAKLIPTDQIVYGWLAFQLLAILLVVYLSVLSIYVHVSPTRVL